VLQYVEGIFKTDRNDATHYIEVDIGVIRMDVEVPEIENLGATVEAISTNRSHGGRLYVTI
jgi:hypothetical protein